MEAPGFWDHVEASQQKMKELKSLKDDVGTFAKLKGQLEDIETLIEMANEEEDASLVEGGPGCADTMNPKERDAESHGSMPETKTGVY